MFGGLEKFAISVAEAVGILGFTYVVASIVERRHPIEPSQSKRAIFLNYQLALANIILGYIVGPISGVIVAMIVNMAGGGFITLRADGWWFLLSLAVVVLSVEFQGYWVHRLQHSVPFLWSMHSLHHSSEAMSAVTGARHYWLKHALILVFLPNVAIVFKIPPEVLALMPYLYLTELMAHLNLKVPFGPFTCFINGPQFHRIHHSIEPQHYNKNFCKNLPIFDIIFGTAWIPARDEFPRTGLMNEKPANLIEGVIWPLRHLKIIRRLLESIPARSQTVGTSLSSEPS